MTPGTLVVLEPGPRTLVVDRGRAGYEHLGMPRGGAADAELHAAALMVVGAAAEAATLECTVAGPTLECRDAPVRVAVAGACRVRRRTVDGQDGEVPAWQSCTLLPGEQLRVGVTRGELRAYVGVGGGIDVAPQLGSRSASLRGGLSGLLARPLRAGDLLRAGAAAGDEGVVRLEPPAGFLGGAALRVCVGPHADRLDGGFEELLCGRRWRVSQLSDRTGVRLEGTPLPLRGGTDVPSIGCPPGAVQVSSDGLPILLGCDRGTTGGYAVVAVVVGADLPRLGRLRPGQEVTFALVDADEAVRLRRAAAEAMAGLAAARVGY